MSLIEESLQYPVLIAYLSGANNYTWLHFADGKNVLLSKPLRYFEERLDQFLRVHKTVLINPQYVSSWQVPVHKKSGLIRMQSGTEFPISRRRWPQLEEALLNKTRKPAVDAAAIRRSVVFVTDSATKAALTQQTIEALFPGYLVQCVNRAASLSKSLQFLPDHELPKLILLDARTSSSDRLEALGHLKTLPRLASIPALVLVPPSTNDLVDQGYGSRANSVIVIAEDNSSFVQTIRQTSQFWLNLAALPQG